MSHCWNNSKIKYQTWQLTFSQQGKHNWHILLIKDKNESSFQWYEPFCPIIDTWLVRTRWRLFQKLVVRTRLWYLRFYYRSSWQFLFQNGFTTINVIYLCNTGVPYSLQTQTVTLVFLWEFAVLLFFICFFSAWSLVNSSYFFYLSRFRLLDHPL
jgi:hypothetical protein